MKLNLLTHSLAVITVAFGLWLYFAEEKNTIRDVSNISSPISQAPSGSRSITNDTENPVEELDSIPAGKFTQAPRAKFTKPALSRKTSESETNTLQPGQLVDEYILALQNKDQTAMGHLWSTIRQCDTCLSLLVDMIVNNNIDESIMLSVASNMTELDTDIVLPVFDVMIDPARSSNESIILSEKLMKNGRPEFVTKIFEVIYRAEESGYKDFARQLTWVITKLDNQAGVKPVLDIITGRTPATLDYSKHVSSIFSKVVQNIPEPEAAAKIMSVYYQSANTQEQQHLWEVISHHQDTLVLLAAEAEHNGQIDSIQKFANAIADLPNQHAVDGLMKLHINIEYAPSYLSTILAENLKFNPTVRKLHKLEDYMRDPDIDIESRIFAAEGLLAVRENRHARYILEKVINNTQYADPELQAYIGGRL